MLHAMRARTLPPVGGWVSAPLRAAYPAMATATTTAVITLREKQP